MGHSTKTLTKPPKIGDRVIVRFGPQDMEATVVEDRGNLGVGGRQLIRVEVPVDDWYTAVLELPLDEIRAA
jgi:primosomal protein N'